MNKEMTNKEMRDELYEATVKVLAPGLQEKEDAIKKIDNLSIMNKVYKYGSASDFPNMITKSAHPLNRKKAVRFIKQGEDLYFNMGDWLKPYKNKLFEKLVKGTIQPPNNKRLDQLWMWIAAWQTIENAVRASTAPIEVVKIWQSGRLF